MGHASLTDKAVIRSWIFHKLSCYK